MADLNFLGVTRVYVTCLECASPELYEGGDIRLGRRLARRHTDATGHETHIAEEREFFVSPSSSKDANS